MTEAFDLDFNSLNNDDKNEVDGISILVQMAKSGKIDPWNVDIIDVTDKYLTHLFQTKAQNLRLTGRTLLFASILLKLKSNILEGVDISDFEPQPEEVDFGYDDDSLDYDNEYIPTNNVVSIDEVLQRRTSGIAQTDKFQGSMRHDGINQGADKRGRNDRKHVRHNLKEENAELALAQGFR